MPPWSKIKKQLEEQLADSVRGRVELHATGFRRGRKPFRVRAWISFDKKRLTEKTIWNELNVPRRREWNWWLISDRFSNARIDELLGDLNHIVRSLAILDRRCGKRRLCRMDVSDEHPIVKRFYFIRCYCEGIHKPLEGMDPKELSRPIEEAKKRSDDKSERPSDNEKIQTELRYIEAHSRVKDARSLLGKLCRGELTEDDCVTPSSKLLHAAFLDVQDREQFHQRLLHVESRSKLLKTDTYVRGVICALKDDSTWLRPLETWRLDSQNAAKQFSSLLRHLFARYDVPLFMDAAFMSGSSTQQDWFRHVGSGKNIRSAEGLPVKLDKRTAHHFLQAPHDYSIDAAFRWGQVHAVGGDCSLADALLDTRLVQDFSHNDFWLSVIRFFTRNPMLDRTWINPIIDYLYDQRFRERRVREDGELHSLPPPQPNLTMRGRTALSLIRQVETWHGRLGRLRLGELVRWEKSAINDFKLSEGLRGTSGWKQWHIYELLGSDELIAEGREQKHCVASYIWSCQSGRNSIWTMDLLADSKCEKRVTIELDRRKGEIVQVRGKRNRPPDREEIRVIRQWAQAEKLNLRRYS